MAADASIKPSHIAEIVIHGEVGQPDLVDLQRPSKRINNRQLQQPTTERGVCCKRLLQLPPLGFKICQLLAECFLAVNHCFLNFFQGLAMFIGMLIGDRYSCDIRLNRDKLGVDLLELVSRHMITNTQVIFTFCGI